MTQVYKKREFIIVQFHKGRRKEYMVVNVRKSERLGFKKAHTHIKSFNTGKYIIDLVISGKINNGLSPYLLESLARVSEDRRYQQKVRDLIEVKRERGRQRYHNQPVGMFG